MSNNKHTQELEAENEALQSRVSELERQRDALRGQLEWFIGYAKSEDHDCDDLPNSRHCSICQQIGYAERELAKQDSP